MKRIFLFVVLLIIGCQNSNNSKVNNNDHNHNFNYTQNRRLAIFLDKYLQSDSSLDNISKQDKLYKLYSTREVEKVVITIYSSISFDSLDYPSDYFIYKNKIFFVYTGMENLGIPDSNYITQLKYDMYKVSPGIKSNDSYIHNSIVWEGCFEKDTFWINENVPSPDIKLDVTIPKLPSELVK